MKILLYLLAGLITFIEPTFKFAVVLFFAIILDVLSAIDLAQRVKRTYPNRANGKVSSNQLKNMFRTFASVYLIILLLHAIDNDILGDIYDFKLSAIASALFCLTQIISILENISSCNGHFWAKALQKVIMDKTERHFNINISELKQETK